MNLLIAKNHQTDELIQQNREMQKNYARNGSKDR
jgi:hypothetical protein